ncbi:MAG: nucleotidyltransferase family protein [Nevskia sp.]|nr:nucleotidyltransferase family protein [Nevskia sp.]MCK9383634.1 nucleotidyltransferase family protein [Nevskia sp.]
MSTGAVNSDLAVVILAAGAARRYGGAKQLAQFEGASLVRRAALAALSVADDVTVITGAYAEVVTADLQALPLKILHNPDWALGMGHSLAYGFNAPQTQRAAATLLMLADQVLIGAPQLRFLIATHRQFPERIVAADHGEHLGPPCLFPAAYYPELAALSGDRGARGLLQKHGAFVVPVALPEAAVDIDTPEDYAKLLAASQTNA